MAYQILSNGHDVKLTRPNLPARSNLSEPDSFAKEVIDVLDEAIGGHIWPKQSASVPTKRQRASVPTKRQRASAVVTRPPSIPLEA